MYHPTARVLAVLELLQSHGRMTGGELARRLEVNVRTARRYVETLQDLGIPVEAERGRYGAYRLRPGYKLPPLMFSEDEVLALTLGLLTARKLGLSSAAPAVESALAKTERVLPEGLRDRVRAVEETLVLGVRRAAVAPPNAVVVALSSGARDRHRVWMRYKSSTGEETERDFDPYGLVYRDGRWYATGYCHLRRGQRLFRLDRILVVEPREERFERPVAFDALAEVERSIASRPGSGRSKFCFRQRSRRHARRCHRSWPCFRKRRTGCCCTATRVICRGWRGISRAWVFLCRFASRQSSERRCATTPSRWRVSPNAPVDHGRACRSWFGSRTGTSVTIRAR